MSASMPASRAMQRFLILPRWSPSAPVVKTCCASCMPLPAADSERGAVILGRRHTVFTQARRMAKHEAEHMEQIAGLLK